MWGLSLVDSREYHENRLGRSLKGVSKNEHLHCKQYKCCFSDGKSSLHPKIMKFSFAKRTFPTKSFGMFN